MSTSRRNREVELRNEGEIERETRHTEEPTRQNSEIERVVKPKKASILKSSEISEKAEDLDGRFTAETQLADKVLLRKYVKIRSDLFQTYCIVGAFFSAIGITVYYDTVREEWIPLRAEYLEENGSHLQRSAIEMSKVFACVGVLHSILAIIIIVIGLIYTTHLVDIDETAHFMLNSTVWFLGWDSWDMNLAKIANVNLSVALVSLFVAASADTYNRIDFPYTYVIGFWSVPIVGYISYLVYTSKRNWDRKYAAVVEVIHELTGGKTK